MATLKKEQTLSIINMVAVLFAIGINYYSQLYTIHGNRVSDMSDEYNNLFTPAGYAFAIWGIIFLALFIFAAYQIYLTVIRKRTFNFISQSGLWFAIATVGTGLWVMVWLYDYTLVSVFVMLLILFSLFKIVVNTNMERWRAPARTIIFGWWPISIFAGWIAVATIANIAAYLSKLGWDGGPLSPESWTLVMIAIASLTNIILIFTRGMREFALVGVWALVAIYVRHQYSYETIAMTALVGAVIIFISVFLHAFINRKINPFYGKYFK
ncbi:MAG: tryptophan-rich sensory protein [Bacteroidales bacterium]|nr:tryptophan-rich sensory protein [Bacteroidales bacterium]